MKEREHTGCHSPVKGSGRSLPPLGAIQIICEPPLHDIIKDKHYHLMQKVQFHDKHKKIDIANETVWPSL
jgi:hypothetical protein